MSAGVTGQRWALCRLSEIAEDRPFGVTLPDGTPVAVFRMDCGVAVTDDICTHNGAAFTEYGEVGGNAVECTWHGCKFDLRTGEVLEGPCSIPLKLHGCVVEDDTVYGLFPVLKTPS